MFALGFGTQEIVIIVGIVVLLFGAKKIPELGRSLGDGLREFKRSTRAAVEDDDKEEKKDEKEGGS